MEIKGSLSDLNLGENSSVPALNPSPHTVWQAILPVFRQESNPLLDFLFALLGNPFKPCRNLDLEFCIAVMKNPCCFQVFSTLFYTLSHQANKKFLLHAFCSLSTRLCKPFHHPIHKHHIHASSPILVQLPNIYLHLNSIN